jgi:hypothetical protein
MQYTTINIDKLHELYRKLGIEFCVKLESINSTLNTSMYAKLKRQLVLKYSHEIFMADIGYRDRQKKIFCTRRLLLDSIGDAMFGITCSDSVASQEQGQYYFETIYNKDYADWLYTNDLLVPIDPKLSDCPSGSTTDIMILTDPIVPSEFKNPAPYQINNYRIWGNYREQFNHQIIHRKEISNYNLKVLYDQKLWTPMKNAEMHHIITKASGNLLAMVDPALIENIRIDDGSTYYDVQPKGNLAKFDRVEMMRIMFNKVRTFRQSIWQAAATRFASNKITTLFLQLKRLNKLCIFVSKINKYAVIFISLFKKKYPYFRRDAIFVDDHSKEDPILRDRLMASEDHHSKHLYGPPKTDIEKWYETNIEEEIDKALS